MRNSSETLLTTLVFSGIAAVVVSFLVVAAAVGH